MKIKSTHTLNGIPRTQLSKEELWKFIDKYSKTVNKSDRSWVVKIRMGARFKHQYKVTIKSDSKYHKITLQNDEPLKHPCVIG